MKRGLGFAIALALGAPLAAFANDAYVVSDISLQSGPDTDYPPIDNLSAGTEVDVQGCVEGFSWCDVIVGEDRGWVPGSFIEEDYNNQPEFLVDYGPRIGIPVVSFNIGVYWDAHYHSRPFYAQRTEWVNRHIAVRAPPRPSIAHAPPIPNRGSNHGAPIAHPQPAHAAAKPVVHDEHAQTSHDEMTNRATRERTAVAPKPQEHAPTTAERTPPKPAEHAPPKPVEHAPPKPKEDPKKDDKQPEHKDDDHGH